MDPKTQVITKSQVHVCVRGEDRGKYGAREKKYLNPYPHLHGLSWGGINLVIAVFDHEPHLHM